MRNADDLNPKSGIVPRGEVRRVGTTKGGVIMTCATVEPGVSKSQTLPLLLASRSPRRRALLTQHGFEHIAVHPGFEDGVLEPGGVTPAQWVQALATLKAFAGADQPEAAGRVVLAADTACLQAGTLIGTPSDADEARAMIASLVGHEHEVLTGVALLDLRGWEGSAASLDEDRRWGFVDVATVRVGEISDSELDRYIASGLWQGKAGAYNLSERLEAGWPLVFSGDPSTIMGLPMRRLSVLLSRMAATTTPEVS
jgi:septum formation protein